MLAWLQTTPWCTRSTARPHQVVLLRVSGASRMGTCNAWAFAMHGYLQRDSVRRAAPRRTCSCRLACTSPGVWCVCLHHPPQCLQTLLQPLPGSAHAQHPKQPPQTASAATEHNRSTTQQFLRGIGDAWKLCALRLHWQGFIVSCCGPPFLKPRQAPHTYLVKGCCIRCFGRLCCPPALCLCHTLAREQHTRAASGRFVVVRMAQKQHTRAGL